MFDLDTLKDKLDGETLTKLRAHVDDITGQRDAARAESIDGRKKLKADLAAAQAAQAKAFEKLGIDSADELEALPAAKGQGEALKQLEVKLKRVERERDDAVSARDQISADMTAARRSAVVSQAVAAGGFHDTEAAELLLSRAIEQQDDGQFVFKTKDGKFIPPVDGAKLIATERPHLVKAPQGTGSGYRDGGDADGGRKSAPGKPMGGTREERIAAINERFKLPA